jgi:SSS family solute:Na+ symporter
VAGFLKIVPLFALLLPHLLVGTELAGTASANGTYQMSASGALLRPGVKGAAVVSVLAALTSSLASSFNSSSTLFTMDFYRQLRPQASEKELVLVGRLTTTVLVIVAILWVPFLRYMSLQMCLYLQGIHACIAPAVAAVFVLGILWPRVNAPGAITALCVGTALGALRLVLELLDRVGDLHSPVFQYLVGINFLDFGALLFLVSAAVLIAVSLLTGPPQPKELQGLTFATAGALHTDHSLKTSTGKLNWKWANAGLSFLLLMTVLVLYSWVL